jgi:hypothetical protein
MFLFTFHATVNPKAKLAPRFNEVGGAYVSCYINFKDYEASEALARLLIKEQGWILKAKTDECVMLKRYCKTKKHLQYYSEAIKYGYTLVFDVYPKDAEDADVDYEAEKRKRRKVKAKAKR